MENRKKHDVVRMEEDRIRFSLDNYKKMRMMMNQDDYQRKVVNEDLRIC